MGSALGGVGLFTGMLGHSLTMHFVSMSHLRITGAMVNAFRDTHQRTAQGAIGCKRLNCCERQQSGDEDGFSEHSLRPASSNWYASFGEVPSQPTSGVACLPARRQETAIEPALPIRLGQGLRAPPLQFILCLDNLLSSL